MELRGATALVTGASSGIGMATAEALAAAGVTVAVSGRRVDVLNALAGRITAHRAPQPVALATDLAMPGAAAELGARACEALRHVDILVNGAGAFEAGAAAADDAAARALFEMNYWAPVVLTRTLVPGMRAHGKGVVVNLSSIAMVTPLPATGSYPASKAALAAATEAIRLELAGSGVHLVLAFLVGMDLGARDGPATSRPQSVRFSRDPAALTTEAASPGGAPRVHTSRHSSALPTCFTQLPNSTEVLRVDQLPRRTHSTESFCGEFTSVDTTYASSSSLDSGTSSPRRSPSPVRGSSQRSRASGGTITGMRLWIIATSSFARQVTMAHVAMRFPTRYAHPPSIAGPTDP